MISPYSFKKSTKQLRLSKPLNYQCKVWLQETPFWSVQSLATGDPFLISAKFWYRRPPTPGPLMHVSMPVPLIFCCLRIFEVFTYRRQNQVIKLLTGSSASSSLHFSGHSSFIKTSFLHLLFQFQEFFKSFKPRSSSNLLWTRLRLLLLLLALVAFTLTTISWICDAALAYRQLVLWPIL